MQWACATPSDPAWARPTARRAGGWPLVLALLFGPLAAWVVRGPVGLGILPPLQVVPGPQALVVLLVVSPVLEELVFRGGLQRWLEQRAFGRTLLLPGVDAAVVISSAGFALAHAFHGPLALAIACLAPSLVFGWLWRTYRHLGVPMAVHAWYNACLLMAFL